VASKKHSGFYALQTFETRLLWKATIPISSVTNETKSKLIFPTVPKAGTNQFNQFGGK